MRKIHLIFLFVILNMSFIQSQVIDKYSIAAKSSIFAMLPDEEILKGLEANAFTQEYIYSVGYYNGNDEWIFSD